MLLLKIQFATNDLPGYLSWYGSCGRHTWTCHCTEAVDILDICHGMEAVDDILGHLSWYGICDSAFTMLTLH